MILYEVALQFCKPTHDRRYPVEQQKPPFHDMNMLQPDKSAEKRRLGPLCPAA